VKKCEIVIALVLQCGAASACAEGRSDDYTFSHVCAELENTSLGLRLVAAVDMAPVGSADSVTLWVCRDHSCDPVFEEHEDAPFAAEWTSDGSLRIYTMSEAIGLGGPRINTQWGGEIRLVPVDRTNPTARVDELLVDPVLAITNMNWSCRRADSL
jgi:hypothetical protein